MHPGQFLLFLGVIIVGIWLILKHQRTKKFTQDYMEYKKKAIDKDVDTTTSDLIFFEHCKQTLSLRISLISLSLGITFILMVFVLTGIFPDLEEDVKKLFLMVGALLVALGIGTLLNWIFIDKPKQEMIQKKLKEKSEIDSDN